MFFIIFVPSSNIAHLSVRSCQREACLHKADCEFTFIIVIVHPLQIKLDVQTPHRFVIYSVLNKDCCQWASAEATMMNNELHN